MEKLARILVVEDDVSLAQWIIEYLDNKGFQTAHLMRGDEVEPYVRQHQVDLVLLDLMLPGLDGHQVCKQLRPFFDAPIIMLTARDDEFDEVLGLELGANDYLLKPVRPRALLTRIKTELQQYKDQCQLKGNKVSSQLTFGGLMLDAQSQRAELNQTDLALTTTEFELLWLLASSAGQVLDRDTVFKKMKGWEYDGLDRRIDVLISGLRRKVGDSQGKAKRIKTVWGKGYLFVADAWE
ncbi:MULTISPECIES: response regulator [unclassified Motilimonas]|uniref:response regulator n=1 Tax=Motilimonas TaxID=1914248 RepID=UPI001E4E0B7A|nr:MULTISPECIES: response regulator [unclassified Motilimonas]MCE0557551.1 response regulator [Motilimonas sp. E26]MDO6524565.1 response regulator [Motilimonas sp. 1_MG-2023]